MGVAVSNSCLNCLTEIGMNERYCDKCRKRVDAGEPRGSFGRFLAKCDKCKTGLYFLTDTAVLMSVVIAGTIRAWRNATAVGTWRPGNVLRTTWSIRRCGDGEDDTDCSGV